MRMLYGKTLVPGESEMMRGRWEGGGGREDFA